jgi:hypothetical protein
VVFQGDLTFNSDICLGRDFSGWKDDSEDNDLEPFYFWITVTIDIILFIN